MRISWGTGIVIFYVLFATTTIAFVVFATSQPVDLVRPDYYEESLRRNERSTEEQNARALGTGVAVHAKDDTVFIRLPRQFAHTSGTVQLYRAAGSQNDVIIPLAIDTSGTMRIAMRGRPHGHWDVRIAWHDSASYRYSKSVYIDSPTADLAD